MRARFITMRLQQAFASLSRGPRGVLVSREISHDIVLQRSGCSVDRPGLAPHWLFDKCCCSSALHTIRRPKMSPSIQLQSASNEWIVLSFSRRNSPGFFSIITDTMFFQRLQTCPCVKATLLSCSCSSVMASASGLIGGSCSRPRDNRAL